jgi:probable F420-dependent oxidoreductase
MSDTPSSLDPVTLRFGVSLHVGRDDASRRPGSTAKEAEEAGFDIVTVADHVGFVSPLVTLAAAAQATSRVRLRTYVLDHGFWNPGLLARDVATLDAISDGRVELGLGAGHMPAEHAAVGLPFPAYRERVTALDAFAREVAQRLADPSLDPKPVQQPVPVFLAAMSPSGLDVAARHGELVALAGALQAPGAPAGTFVLASSEQTQQRVDAVRAARASAGLPPCTFDALLQLVVVDRDPRQVAQEWAAQGEGRFSVDDLLDTPFVLLAASPQEAVDELQRRAEQFGITSWCTHGPSGPALSKVIAQVRR